MWPRVVGFDAPGAYHGKGLRGKGFIEFDDTQFFETEIDSPQGLFGGGDGVDSHRAGRYSGDCPGRESRDGTQPELRSLVGCCDDSECSAVVLAAGVACSDGGLGVDFPRLGRSVDSDSTVVSARGCSSVSTTSGSPLRCGTYTPTISWGKTPLFCAATAFWCDEAASASWSARQMKNSALRFSAVSIILPGSFSRRP